jgi:hypothetical protein
MNEGSAASESLRFIYKVWKMEVEYFSPYYMIMVCLTRSGKFAIESKAGGLYLQRKSGGLAGLGSLTGLRNLLIPKSVQKRFLQAKSDKT